MNSSEVRVRFAPAPTGIMHLGNVRTALFNYLFALQKKGTFILRIEDTDPERLFDAGGKQIMEDLAWLGLTYQEGPLVGGNYGPYYQSERSHIYKEKLLVLQKQGNVYRCFCTTEELLKKRERQVALKQPPRYDKACLALSEQDIQKKLQENIPYIWRFNIGNYTTAIVDDMARGKITFDLTHFSDFPITRQNGDVTFLFANTVDDILMRVSHVLRGEDHLSNTANQSALFQAFGEKQPIYWHLPILCNVEGKKLSKRDFGFSLQDLKNGGFLPEAINNYLAIIGASFAQEIMNTQELVSSVNFESINPTGTIKYDVEKLRWVNHKWIERCNPDTLQERALPFLYEAFPVAKNLSSAIINQLLQTIKSELITLQDIRSKIAFYFEQPTIQATDIYATMDKEHATTLAWIITAQSNLLPNIEAFFNAVKQHAQENAVPNKALFAFFRFALTGTTTGPRIHDIMDVLGAEETKQRLVKIITLLA